MMLHDPEFEVTCDNGDCEESVFLPAMWTTGGYDLKDDRVVILLKEHGWSIDGEYHICADCTEELEKL